MSGATARTTGDDGPVVVTVRLGARSYPVVIGRGLLAEVPAVIPLPAGVRRALLVAQPPVVTAGYADTVASALGDAGIDVHRHEVPDGEAAKAVDVLGGLWQACARIPLSRTDVMVAVGGGVVGDLTGFAAATFARGLSVVQVPTTLLAQVDAAVGGKTGINLPEGKNLVGAFHQPVGVVCDVTTLSSLAPRVLVEGLGEVVKYGLIHDPLVLERLEERPDAVASGDPHLLHHLVARSADAKARIVSADEREHGPRAYLNFGHTYGHVVEALTGYHEVLHGEAVAIGMVVALRLGVRLGHTPPDLAARGEAVIARVGLPVRGPALDRDDVWRTLARDKKAAADRVRFVVLDGLAAPALVTPPQETVDEVLDELERA